MSDPADGDAAPANPRRRPSKLALALLTAGALIALVVVGVLVGGPPLDPITSADAAERVVGEVMRATAGLVAGLDEGNHAGTTVHGVDGRAVVTGHKEEHVTTGCLGGTCTRTNDHSLTIVFDEFRRELAYDDGEVYLVAEISGTVTYADTEASDCRRGDGTCDTSGGRVVEGTDVHVRYEGEEDRRWEDTLAFQAATPVNSVAIHGWCTPENGETYTF